MIDLSAKLGAPAWDRVVTELTKPVGDELAFLRRLASVLGQVGSAKQAVLVMVNTGGNPDPNEHAAEAAWVWTPSGAGAPADIEPESREHSIEGATLAARAGKSRIFGLHDPGASTVAYYPASGPSGASAQLAGGCLVAVPVPGGSGAVRPVVALLLETRSTQAIQTTLALSDVIAGYAHGAGAQIESRRLRAASATLELGSQLIAGINASRRFRGACMRLANELMRTVAVDRVAVGWARSAMSGAPAEEPRRGDDACVAVAISDTEHLDRRTAMVKRLEAAMDECLDQEHAVLHPPPGDDAAEPVLASAVTRSHADLAARDARLRVASLPLRVDGRVVGVITLEASVEPGKPSVLEPQAIEPLQATLDLIAPVLALRRREDRPPHKRAWQSVRSGAAWLLGPTQTGWKLAGVAAAALLISSVLIRVEYRIEAPATLEPIERRTMSVPFDGIIAAVPEGIRAGARVEAGQLLAELDVTELRLSALEAQGETREALARADEAMNQRNLAEAQRFRAQADQSKARVDLLNSRIARARLVSPISGTIVAGEAEDLVGASVELGKPLFEIAPLERMEVVVRVRDDDAPLIAAGTLGSLATRARPAERFPVVVQRIVPQAQGEEGGNRFRVTATLDDGAAWMRPGMEGLVKLETGERTLLGVGARRIVDTLRLWLWW
ncbi:MAG: HlyD family efflux transporter periplasmic adaptor subunit [Planctomycetota bacterium]